MVRTDELSWTSDLLTAPHDVSDEASRVRRMFNGIAPRYELVNRLFSGGRDAAWRRKAVALADVQTRDEVLDVACGTGDFTRAFASAGARSVVGCDFAHEMLVRAVEPRRDRVHSVADGPHPPCRRGPSGWCEADALRLPFRCGSFSIVCCAFGVRNFADLDAGLAEMLRVLRPGGRLVILEFTRPRNRIARGFYEIYSARVMPVAATLISGDTTGAYRYLPQSVVSFVGAGEMVSRLQGVGFARATATPLTLGVVTVYVARRD